MSLSSDLIREAEEILEIIRPKPMPAWRFWTCPELGHSQGAWRTMSMETVNRDDTIGVASCNFPGCEHTSAEAP